MAYSMVVICSFLAAGALGILLESKQHIFNLAGTASRETPAVPFPVGVDILAKAISENPDVEDYYYHTLANAPGSTGNWWNKVAATFDDKEWFQNLASPVSRIFIIWPGERKEEVSKNISDIMGWNKQDRLLFQQLVDAAPPILSDGKYYPGQYVAHKSATPVDIYRLITEMFETEVLSRYTADVESKVPLQEALIIASLLEREASDFENMREVSGVIWNRLFTDMPLQLDATLQYIRGSNPNEPNWWPKVNPRDKFIDSAYNTYKNIGLPPAPIANPSAEALLAALNPATTDCLFYFHSRGGEYHCSATYEGHVAKLKSIYGQGQ